MAPVQLTDEQADEFQKWTAAIPEATTLVSPKVIAVDGEMSDLSVTTQHESIISYTKPEEASAKPKPVSKKFTTGVNLNITPKFHLDGKTVILKIAFSKTDLVRLAKETDKSGNKIKLPVLNTAEINTTICVANGKITLVPVVVQFLGANSDDHGKPTRQTLLLIKSTTLKPNSKTHVQVKEHTGVIASNVKSVIEFHVLPETGRELWNDLSSDTVDKYIKELKKDGPLTGSTRDDGYQWLMIDDNLQINKLISGEHNGRQYVLHCAREKDSMYPDGKWGIIKAYPAMDYMRKLCIKIEFDGKGSELFYKLTGSNIGNRLAMIIDGKIYSAPRINSAIMGHSMIIGNFKETEVKDLAEIICNGMPSTDTHIKVYNSTANSSKSDPSADVAIVDMQINPYSEGNLYHVTVAIRNSGKAPTSQFGVYFYRDGKKPMTHSAGPIEPGKIWNERSMPFALKEGVNNITVTIDPENKIAETDEANNVTSMEVTVTNGKITSESTTTSHVQGTAASRPSHIPSTSTINKDWRIEDEIDYPFVNDPEVIGGWKSIDFVRNIKDFKPSEKNWKGDLYLNNLIFQKNGTVKGDFLTWTKGLVICKHDKTASKYIVKKINGTDYMFYEWKSGDYTTRHSKPSYYVLTRVLLQSIENEPLFGKKAIIPPTSYINEKGHVIDKTDYPFVNDPQVIGKWNSVDFVKEINQFNPAKKNWKGDLFLGSMDFKNDAKVYYTLKKTPDVISGSDQWTRNLVLDKDTASKYIIKTIDGSEYMFFEWKSGDYRFRHRKPSYYVLRKTAPEKLYKTKQESLKKTQKQISKTYSVKKTVAEFKNTEDLSTPEAAYATMLQINASGQRYRWPRLTIKRFDGFPEDIDEGKVVDLPPGLRDWWLNTIVLEVTIYGNHASVIGLLPSKLQGETVPERFDYRQLRLENGKWLYTFEGGRVESLDKAREKFQLSVEQLQKPAMLLGGMKPQGK